MKGSFYTIQNKTVSGTDTAKYRYSTVTKLLDNSGNFFSQNYSEYIHKWILNGKN